MRLKKKNLTPIQFQRILVKGVKTGAVTKQEIAEKFYYTVRAVERWMDGTRTPAYKIVQRDVARFVRGRMKKTVIRD